MRQEVEQYKTHFQTADADGNGSISMLEAQKYLTEQVGLDHHAVIAKFNEFDKDASGDLDQIEFAVMMSSLAVDKTTLAEGVPGERAGLTGKKSPHVRKRSLLSACCAKCSCSSAADKPKGPAKYLCLLLLYLFVGALIVAIGVGASRIVSYV